MMFEEILVPQQFKNDLFVDDSYHNDACPSFIFTGNIKEDEVEYRIDSETYVKVWVAHQAAEEREGLAERFCVSSVVGGQEVTNFCTNDIDQVFKLLLSLKLNEWAGGGLSWYSAINPPTKKELLSFLKDS